MQAESHDEQNGVWESLFSQGQAQLSSLEEHPETEHLEMEQLAMEQVQLEQARRHGLWEQLKNEECEQEQHDMEQAVQRSLRKNRVQPPAHAPQVGSDCSSYCV